MKASSNVVQSLRGVLSTAAVDAAFFLGALHIGMAWYSVHLASFAAACLVTFLIESLYHRVRPLPQGRPGISTLDIVIVFCVLFLRGGFLATLIDVLDVSPSIAAICGAVFSAAAFFGGRHVWSFDNLKAAEEEAHRIWWRAGSVILFVVLLRLLYSGPFELLHEEGYYWLYAQFLDIGYLDHPPMVGWLIWLFTSLFGPSELAVRIGAFACWLITAGYAARLSKSTLR